MRYKHLIKHHNTAFICPLDAPLLHAINAVIARGKAPLVWFILPKSRPLSSTSTMSARASLWLWLIQGRFEVKRPSDGERIDNLRPARGQSWGQGAVSSAVGRGRGRGAR